MEGRSRDMKRETACRRTRLRSADADRRAERLNNDLLLKPRGPPSSTKSAARSDDAPLQTPHSAPPRPRSGNNASLVNERGENRRQSTNAVAVEIWTSSAFLRERVGTASLAQSGWLRVTGNGCPLAPETKAVRPSTAPATVKRLQLTTRPALDTYRPRISIPPLKLIRKPKPFKKEIKEELQVQGKETLLTKDRLTHDKRSVAGSGETHRGDQLKKRKAMARKKAESEFRQLLSMADDSQETVASISRLRFPPYLEPSPFPEMAATICFQGTPGEKQERRLVPVTGKKLFVHFTGMASTPVRLAFLKAGFRVTKSPTKWNVLWGLAPNDRCFEKMNRYQRVNHFPGSAEIGRKDKLCRNYKEMQNRDSDAYRFMPKCFLLPNDRVALRQDVANHKGRRYIVKPVASSCGRGIRITSDPSLFTCAKECVVQRYIGKPMTIDGFKFDLRIYAGVTSYSPLRVYVYEDGLVRFATKSYTSKNDMDNRYVHITNTSVNRRSGDYVKNRHAEETDCGSKWSLGAFRSYVTKHRLVEWSHIWKQVREIVAKTFACVRERMLEHLRSHRVPHPTSCFEIYGFDILLDSTHRAWLLEVNTWPDLAGTSPLDQKLKTKLIEDMMHMIGVVPRFSARRASSARGDAVAVAETVRFAESIRRGGWEIVIT